MGHAGGHHNPVGIIDSAAGLADVAVDAAVQLQDIPASGHLVQAVNILCYHSRQSPGTLQFGQLFVGGVGLGSETDHFVSIKSVELLCVPFKVSVAEDGFRRYGKLLVIQSVLTAEIRNAALCGNAGTAEEDNPPGGIDPGLQLRNG